MALLDQIQTALKEAMKSGDKARMLTLRSVISDVKYAQVEKGHAPEDSDVLTLVQRGARKRQEAIQAYEAAGREDLAEKERVELAILQHYLPQKMDAGELELKVRQLLADIGATSKKDFSKAMKETMAKFRGAADGGEIRKLIERLLSAP